MTDEPGDPRGRWIARRQHRRLEHAGRAAALLRVLLRRSRSPLTDQAAALERKIADAERIEIERGGGAIESRKRFRRPDSGGNPLREQRPLDWLFIDESGAPQPAASRGSEASFALAGVAMSLDQARSYEAAANALKEQFFGRTDIVLHEPLMRKHRQDFRFGGDRRRQHAFIDAVDDLVLKTNFTAFAVGIRKWALAAGGSAPNPYLPSGVYEIAMHLLLERDVFEWIRSDCLQEPRRWQIFEAKFYRRGDLRIGKYGLKVFPADDAAEQVEAQRERIRLRRP